MSLVASERSDEVASWFREFHKTGDRSLRNRLVESHLGLADFYVKRYSRRGVPDDDLRQVAVLAVLLAVERFDPELGIEFSTFASRTVEGELKRHFRDRTWTVRPPRRSQELHLALRQASEELTQRLGRSPSVHEISAELGESVDHVLEAMEAGMAHQSTSLDQPVSAEKPDSARAERIVAQNEPGFDGVDRRLLVDNLLAHLSERDRAVIQMRFFENLSQEEIAERINVSQSYLSRILRRILLDLRERMATTSEMRVFDEAFPL